MAIGNLCGIAPDERAAGNVRRVSFMLTLRPVKSCKWPRVTRLKGTWHSVSRTPIAKQRGNTPVRTTRKTSTMEMRAAKRRGAQSNDAAAKFFLLAFHEEKRDLRHCALRHAVRFRATVRGGGNTRSSHGTGRRPRPCRAARHLEPTG